MKKMKQLHEFLCTSLTISGKNIIPLETSLLWMIIPLASAKIVHAVAEKTLVPVRGTFLCLDFPIKKEFLCYPGEGGWDGERRSSRRPYVPYLSGSDVILQLQSWGSARKRFPSHSTASQQHPPSVRDCALPATRPGHLLRDGQTTTNDKPRFTTLLALVLVSALFCCALITWLRWGGKEKKRSEMMIQPGV